MRQLIEVHKTLPQGFSSLSRMVVPDLLMEAQRLATGLPTFPTFFHPSDLRAREWGYMLELQAHQGTQYARTAFSILADLRDGVTLAGIRQRAAAEQLQPQTRLLFDKHLELGGRFIKDKERFPAHLIKEGAVIIVEVRDRWLREEQRVVLASVILEVILRIAREKGLHVVFGFDEAHHVLRSPVLLSQIEEMIKERRHFGCSVVLSGLDMLALPESLLALAGLMIMHRNTSEANLKHHMRAHPRWREADPRLLAGLPPGRVLALATAGMFSPGLEVFLNRPRLLDIRDRVSKHGGHTRTVV